MEGAPVKGKVLIVDDNQTVLDIAKWVLGPAGYQVVTSTSPMCWPLIERERPHVMLVDIKMPGLAGDEVAKIVKEYAALLQGGLIVLHSNMPEARLEELTTRCGASGYMPKCDDPEDFVRRIEYWVRMALARQGTG